ncbi:MAG TPA: YqgE/AlgH family protein [Thermoanaerobaculia bacterium]|nr:YqgE/AlgH family protein [Thermoanaerobaculia bacterium]
MSSETTDLSAPIFLLAMPQVLDPFFHRSVVLLIHHDEDGSFGFIVNRPTGIRVGEILKGMEVNWTGRESSLAYFGGPVQPQMGTVLFQPTPSVEELADAASEVVPGLSITQHVGDLAQLATAPPDRFRLFLGYAGWGAGQLVEEILRNDWLTAPVASDLVFATEPDGVWSAALRSVGVDPAALPSWTPAGDDRAN